MEMMRDLPYQYAKLQHADETRLLVLGPRTSSDEITCRLEHTRLSNNPMYEALSYAWEGTSKARRVVCENSVIEVTESLFSALRRLCYEDRERVIWADAISIDQSSDIEKNHQVALMGRIYSQSHKTLAWVGEESEEVLEKASDYVSRLDAYLSSQVDGYRTKRLGKGDLAIPNRIRTELSEKWALELLEKLQPIFQKSWFSRLWVLQEVVLSAYTEIILGTWTIHFDTFIRPIMVMGCLIFFPEVTVDFNWQGFNGFIDMGIVRTSFEHDKESLNMLGIFGLRQANLVASDPRDYIYGLLGLGLAPGLTADYTLSANEVFQKFALWNLHESNNLMMLSYAGIGRSGRNSVSWAPAPRNSKLTLYEMDQFNASVEPLSSENNKSPASFWSLSGTNILRLSGRITGDIVNIAGLSIVDRQNDDCRDVFIEWAKIAKCTKTTLSDERYERFCRAIICELSVWGDRASPEDFEAIDYCFQVLVNGLNDEADGRSVNDILYMTRMIIKRYLCFNKFCITNDDRFAWVPDIAERGDSICFIRGGKVPFVLRPAQGGKFILVGECWVQGLMDGEVLSLPGFKWEEILLL